MFPPVHPGVAYLLFAAYARLVDGSPPSGPVAVGLVAGAVVPDLVDLPLYYLAGAPSTRTVAHSLLALVGLSVVVRLAVGRSSVDGRVGPGVAAGYLSHLLADAVWPVVLGLPAELRYLGWPLTQQPLYEGTKSLGAVGGATVTTLWIESALLTVALAVWWRDGRPGLGERNGCRDGR